MANRLFNVLKKFVIVFCMIMFLLGAVQLGLLSSIGFLGIAENSVYSAGNSQIGFDVSFNKTSLSNGLLTATISANNTLSDDVDAASVIAYYKNGILKSTVVSNNKLINNATTNYAVSINLTNVEDIDSVKLFIWESSTLTPLYNVDVLTMPKYIINEDFTGVASGTSLSENSSVLGWRVSPFMETITPTGVAAYTSSLGSKLFGKIVASPLKAGFASKQAIYLYDNVGRTTDAVNGAGAILASRQLPEIDTDYTVRFKMYIPNALANNNYAGVTLSNGSTTDNSDVDNLCALQLRTVLKSATSIDFVNNSSTSLSNGSTYVALNPPTKQYKTNLTYDCTLDISQIKKSITVTVSDGTTSYSQSYFYNSMNDANTFVETWKTKKINNIQFNTSTSNGGEMYIGDFQVLTPGISEIGDFNAIINSNLSGYGIDTALSETDSMLGWKDAVVNESGWGYTPKLGKKLYAQIKNVPTNLASKKIGMYLYDNVGRTTDATNGAGSATAYRSIAEKTKPYTIKFKMLSTNILGASNWAGLTLSNGFATGTADTTNNCAFQLKIKQMNANQVQFFTCASLDYNQGTTSTLLGATKYFTQNVPWDFSLAIDPVANTIDITVSDGIVSEIKTVKYNSTSSTKSENWTTKFINNIQFNTGAGDSSELYIYDFSMIDNATNTSISNPPTSEIATDNVPIYKNNALLDWDLLSISEGTAYAYTPSLGANLYSKTKLLPTAVASGKLGAYIYDDVGRTTDATNGAGAMAIRKALPLLSNTYTISFKMYMPTSNFSDISYAGFTLSNGVSTGPADTTNYCALQVRMGAPTANTVKFNSYPSLLYNQTGANTPYNTSFMGVTTPFITNVPWSFTLTVDPVTHQITIVASDGTTTETKIVSYNSKKATGTFVENWATKNINNIEFNSGVSGSCEMYVYDFKVVDNTTNVALINEVISGATTDIPATKTKPVLGWNTDVISEGSTYTPSLGDKLYARIKNIPSTLENGKVGVYIHDGVGRTTSASNGAGSIIAYRTLPELNNSYEIKFKMFVPTAGGAYPTGDFSYSGFSLTNGVSNGTSDVSSYCALQIRLRALSNFANARLDYNTSLLYNEGSTYQSLLGATKAFKANVPWDVSLTVNPVDKTILICISDGTTTESQTVAFNSFDMGGWRKEFWNSKRINNIQFNTSGYGKSETYIYDFQVIDNGKNTIVAKNAVTRLQSYNLPGYFITNTLTAPVMAQNLSPLSTGKFIERVGLSDSTCVSYESLVNPGYFLKSSGTSIIIQKDSGTDTFAKESTFYKESGLKDAAYVSLRSYISPTMYVRHSANDLILDVLGDDTMLQDSTFELLADVNPKVNDQFSGTTLNTDKWDYNYSWGDTHNHSAVMRAKQVTVQNGKLHIEAVDAGKNISNAAGG